MDLGYGLLFQVGDGATPTENFTTVGHMIEFTPPGQEVDDVEYTEFDAPAYLLQYMPGLIEGGEVGIKVNTDMSDPLQAETAPGLWHKLLNRWTGNVRYVLNDARSTTVTFPAYVKSRSPETPMKEQMTTEFTIKMAGGPLVIA